MIGLNKDLVAAIQKHLVPQFALETEYKPWWWPKSPGRFAADWGLRDSQLSEFASLSNGAAKMTKRSATYQGFVGSVAAAEGAAWLLSIRPSPERLPAPSVLYTRRCATTQTVLTAVWFRSCT